MEGSFADRQWVTKFLDDEYFVTKARVRFHIRCGFQEQITADLHEFDFHGADWVSPTGYDDPAQEWDDELYAFDDILSTKAGCTTTQFTWHWTPFLELSLSQPLYTDKIRFYAWYSWLYCNKIDVDVYYGDGYLAAKTGL